MDERISYRVEHASQVIGIGRAMLYRYIRSGELKTFTIGKRRLVSVEALREFVAAREKAQQHSAAAGG